jgi:hypothetical protein
LYFYNINDGERRQLKILQVKKKPEWESDSSTVILGGALNSIENDLCYSLKVGDFTYDHEKMR